MRYFSKKYYGFTPHRPELVEGLVRGFTFVEVILVIGIIGIIAGLGVPFYQSFQVSSQLDNTTQEIVQTLRRAQNKAMASEAFTGHGVHFESNQFILFRGSSYSSTDDYNEVVPAPPTIFITYEEAGSDVVFSRILGEAAYSGLIMINSSGGESNKITINEMGVVNVL